MHNDKEKSRWNFLMLKHTVLRIRHYSALKTAESQMMLLILVHTEGSTRIDSLYSLQKYFLEGGEHLWTTIFHLLHSTYYTATSHLLNVRESRVFEAYRGYSLVQPVPCTGEGSFPSHLVSGHVLGQDRGEDSSHWFLLFPHKKVVQMG